MKIIDVRSDQEYKDKHVKDAVNFPVQNMSKGVFPKFSKDEEIGLYCRSGGRSEVALDLMRQAGFTNVRNLGGLDDLV